MAIHGITSTYFGDLEYDIGKSLLWLQNFCSTNYVLDINLSDRSRKFVVDWDKEFPTTAYSFFTDYSFFDSPAKAATWRKTSFQRALAKFAYDDNDWVLFVDGTEGLNVFHDPPVEFSVDRVTLVATVDTSHPGTATYHTTAAFLSTDIAVGYTVSLYGFTATDSGGNPYFPQGKKYTVTAVNVGARTFTVSDPLIVGAGTNLVISGTADVTREPHGFRDGNLFQCWVQDEIDAALTAGKDTISLPAYAVIHEHSLDTNDFTYYGLGLDHDVDGNPIQVDSVEYTATVQTSVKNYLSMNSMVRLVKVSRLKNAAFDWTTLDTLNASPVFSAVRLAIISYAYLRWANSPSKMTQSGDPAGPNYDAAYPLRPVLIEDDIGFTMRRLISQVRPIATLPLTWGSTDPVGVVPTFNGFNLLDLEYQASSVHLADGTSRVVGYSAFGGTPLYPGIIRRNLREGVWYVGQTPSFRSAAVIKKASDGKTATVVTATPHGFSVGQNVVLTGCGANYNGNFTIQTIPTTSSFTFLRGSAANDALGWPASTPFGIAVASGASIGEPPWDYNLNTFGVLDTTQDPPTPITAAQWFSNIV